jgi:hypothetical protein
MNTDEAETDKKAEIREFGTKNSKPKIWPPPAGSFLRPFVPFCGPLGMRELLLRREDFRSVLSIEQEEREDREVRSNSLSVLPGLPV